MPKLWWDSSYLSGHFINPELFKLFCLCMHSPKMPSMLLWLGDELLCFVFEIVTDPLKSYIGYWGRCKWESHINCESDYSTIGAQILNEWAVLKWWGGNEQYDELWNIDVQGFKWTRIWSFLESIEVWWSLVINSTTVPIKSIHQSRVTGLLKLTKGHRGHTKNHQKSQKNV